MKFRVDTDEKRGTARVVYTINEGEKGAVGEIRFEGNTKFSAISILRKQMKTKAKTPISFFDKSGRLDEAQLQQDLDSVRELYQNQATSMSRSRRCARNVPRRTAHRGRARRRRAISRRQSHLHRRERSTKEQKLRALLKMKEGSVYTPKQIREDVEDD